MPKNIVICCDGTSNDVTCESTNVLRLFRCLERSDRQVICYDAGVGTLADPTQLTWLGKLISRKLDGAIGHSVRENVCKAYQFLARTYQPGDRIYLFGFSRGAYTVRALAGMLHFLGLVYPEQAELDRLGWAVFADDHQDLPISQRFESGRRYKKSFSRKQSVRIHFVGVWDTVSSFGWVWQLRTVPYTANNPSIDHVRHAVAIDEHRAAFQPNLFRPGDASQHRSFQQLWFAGAHGDVGGGYPDKENGLAKVSLEWMIDQAAAEGCRFDSAQVDRFLGRTGELSSPDPLAPLHESTVGLWRLLEFVPRRQWDHFSQPEGMRWFGPNLYARRRIPAGAELHASVYERLARDSNYRPHNLAVAPAERKRGG
ncbi:MAG: DUF2235 domain-containing protein [Aureliella sp.]